MLKKNLHFFIRYAITISLVICVISFSSCTDREENYLSFLDGDYAFPCDMEYNGSIIASAKIECYDGCILVTFTSPSSLNGTALRITPEGSTISYIGYGLSSEAIPPLWLNIGDILSKEKKINAVTYNNGITEIHTEGETDFYDYKTDKDGRLLCAESSKLKINVKEGS